MSMLSAAVHAELADASYADFEEARRPDGSFDFDDLKTALERIGHKEDEPKDPNTGFSSFQADAFLQRWDIINHQPDMESAFSATLFKSKDPNAEQPYVLAVRQIKSLAHVLYHFPGGRVVETQILERVA
ncbi:hypothetical protein SAMN05216588_116133 [Pseudomonas flavescens]|uniref:Uncharacterized protein n=1 Tax=Phytopseudomonas flavescens TaxID=29435 RepID=A0A1G8KGQ4_9GAMM|nr:hypothetical protein [Pseudomonas flavescens]SDI42575.1 hypothetical protein SAMN05216588_116133 [Pseudomonas flavescens]